MSYWRKLQIMKSDNIEEQCKNDLRSLPIFTNHHFELTKAEGKVYISPIFIPISASKTIENHCGIKLLQNNHSLKALYDFLEFKCLKIDQFSIELVVPCLELFNDEDIVKCVKGIIPSVEENQTLMSNLKKTRFVIAENGDKKLCSEIFDPRNKLFVQMESNHCFPSRKIYDYDWLEFLKKMGMITDVDAERILKYAKMIEQENDEKKFAITSKLLCKNFIPQADKISSHILEQLSHVKFLQPSKITGPLFKSLSSTKAKIAYRSSVTPDCFYLVWTSKIVLPEYALETTDRTGRQQELSKGSMKYLGIVTIESLEMNSVKENLEKMAGSTEYLDETSSKTCKRIKDDYRDTYKLLLKKAYQFIHNEGKKKEGIEILEDLSFLLVGYGLFIDQPRKCISDQQSYRYMSPYVNIVLSEFGSFFGTFEKLGFCKDPNISHFWMVLSQIKSHVAEKYLGLNELHKVKIAVQQLSTHLAQKGQKEITQFNHQMEVKALYLPTVKFSNVSDVKMTLACECFIVDDLSLQERLKKFEQPLVILDGNENTNQLLLKHLPESMRPKTLRSSIKEILGKSEKAAVDGDHVSKKFQKRIKSPEFTAAIERLSKYDGTEIDISLTQRIAKSVKVFVRKELETHLEYEGNLIDESSKPRDVFPQILGESSLVIYFSQSCEMSNAASRISDELLKLFELQFKNSVTINSFTQILSKEPLEMSSFLDHMNITKSDSGPILQDSGRSKPLGEEVPSKLHFTLNLDILSTFTKGDLVAYDEGGEGEYYLYVQVVEELDNDTIRIQVNDDEEDDESFIEVPSSKVCAFNQSYHKPQQQQQQQIKQSDLYAGTEISIYGTGEEAKREDEVENVFETQEEEKEEPEKSYEEITKEIREIINELKSKSEEEQKRVFRRLYLKWHPDKHRNKEFSTKVFQFLMNEKENMNKADYSKDYPNWNDQAQHDRTSRDSYEREFNFGGADRQRTHNNSGDGAHGFNQHNRSYDFKGEDIFHNFTPRENPQPAEARRWFKQAKCDLITASSINSSFSEWVCYISHQVYNMCYFKYNLALLDKFSLL